MEAQKTLRISHLAEETRVLGPGRRAVIWVHGCCFHCPGCLAERYKTGPYEEYTPDDIAEWYLAITQAQGLTISGGEPMLQAGLLAQTVAAIRRKRDTGVVVYTGFTYEALLKKAETDAGIRAFLGCIDLLIDGPYLRDMDDGKPYRGSSNQRLIPLTDRYQPDIAGYYTAVTGRQIEINVTSGEIVMIGVPDQDQLAIWRKIKA